MVIPDIVAEKIGWYIWKEKMKGICEEYETMLHGFMTKDNKGNIQYIMGANMITDGIMNSEIKAKSVKDIKGKKKCILKCEMIIKMPSLREQVYAMNNKSVSYTLTLQYKESDDEKNRLKKFEEGLKSYENYMINKMKNNFVKKIEKSRICRRYNEIRWMWSSSNIIKELLIEFTKSNDSIYNT